MAESLGIGYYFANWNTNLLSISVVVCLILYLAGYFYGKIYEKYIPVLKKLDCTFLGLITILGFFQIFMYYALSFDVSTNIGCHILKMIMLSGPIICIVFRVSVLPNRKNVAGLLVGIFISIILGNVSAGLNTNNIFFDTVYYLSEVTETSVLPYFKGYNYYHGTAASWVDVLHEYESYYYFFGMVVREAKEIFGLSEIVTPVFMWSASFVYYMSLGSILVNSVNALFKKNKWIGYVFGILILSPYYTNYFNTTLGFFGNTIRTVIAAYALLLVYLYTKKANRALFIPLFFVYSTLIAVSSSGLFVAAFIAVALLFWMFLMEESYLDYIYWAISILPIIRYGFIIVLPKTLSYSALLLSTLGFVAFICLICWLFRKNEGYLNKIGQIFFALTLAGLVVYPIITKNLEYGYDFYFESRSLSDMCNNYTSHVSELELYRNIGLYIMIALLFINSKFDFKFKIYCVIMFVLFLNPLVAPTLIKFATSEVYSRGFDTLVNPFVLIFLIYNTTKLSKSVVGSIIMLSSFSVFNVKLAKENIEVPYSKNLVFKDQGYNWIYKVSDDTVDLYEYIYEEIQRSDDDRPVFLSQDVSLKGYVPCIEVAFAASDIRSARCNEEEFKQNYNYLTMLYPEKVSIDYLVKDKYQGDYSKFGELFSQYQADYIIVRTNLAVWDERGWYKKSYADAVDQDICDVIYENDTWTILERK